MRSWFTAGGPIRPGRGAGEDFSFLFLILVPRLTYLCQTVGASVQSGMSYSQKPILWFVDGQELLPSAASTALVDATGRASDLQKARTNNPRRLGLIFETAGVTYIHCVS